MNIVAYTQGDPGHSALYELRLGLPFREMRKHGHQVDVFTRTDRDIKRLTTSWPQWVESGGPDIQVMHRNVYSTSKQQDTFDQMHEMGSKLVYEIDDDPTDKHRELGYGDWVAEFMDQADAAIVSTPYLRKVMLETYNKPTYVCYSHLDTETFGQVSLAQSRSIPDRIVIGVVGTRTHWADWAVIVDTLHRLVEEYGDRVVLASAGYKPAYFERLPMVAFQPVEYARFPGLLRQFDIVLSPLDRTDLFNWSKSGVRAMECMAAARELPNGRQGGAVPVCTDLAMYRRLINKKTGVLVKNDDDWYDAVARLIEDNVLRQNLSVNGLKWVRKNRDIAQGYKQWSAAYSTIAGG